MTSWNPAPEASLTARTTGGRCSHLASHRVLFVGTLHTTADFFQLNIYQKSSLHLKNTFQSFVKEVKVAKNSPSRSSMCGLFIRRWRGVQTGTETIQEHSSFSGWMWSGALCSTKGRTPRRCHTAWSLLYHGLAAMLFYFIFFFPSQANGRRVAYIGVLLGLSCFKLNSWASTPPPLPPTMSQILTFLVEGGGTLCSGSWWW